ncbi:unnamed protein product [Rotaria sordida]|uniref:Uncharacterized protein n=1 Tax=Rotaria sordida TaxID=392033 RepID=A0A815N4W6_9BILA|nr:unnamed protein product [Rotaria sordida]
MTSPEFYDNLIISSIFPFKTNKQPTKSKTLRHTFLDGLALLLNGSNKCTSVYPLLKEKKILITCNESLKNDDKIYFDEFFGLIREYSQYCLTSNRHDMKKIYLLLESIIFEYNKNKCIKRITDDLFNDVVSNLKKLSNANVDDLCQKITYGKLKKGSPEYYYLKQKNILLKEFILKLYNWIDYIISNRHAIKNNKNNVELEIILKFQVIGELLYNSEIFRSILSKVYSIGNDVERILYYLDRVSAHHQSLSLIVKTLQRRKSECDQIYKNIQWSFIEPIQTIVELKETPSSSFDKIWLACGLGNDEIKKEFQDKFIQNKFHSYDSNLKLSTCLHSEIRMIDYLIEQNIKEVYDNDVEIGISKLPCYLCSLYIEKLNDDFNRTFYISSLRTNEKIYPNWMFRNNEKDKIIDDIHNQLYKFIKNEVQLFQVTMRNKIDDSDEEATEVEEYIDNWLLHLNMRMTEDS